MNIKVKTRPNSLFEKLEKTGDNEYTANIREPAEDNKANKRLINLISKEFDVSFRKIKIKNPKSRDKILEIG